MSERVEVIISKDGTTEIKTSGFTGAKCNITIDALEKELGTIVETKKTSEYYDADENQYLNILKH